MFKPELQNEIDKRLKEFIEVEMGNRVTPNSWNFLILTLGPIFKRNKVEPEKKDDEGNDGTK